MNVLSLFSGIGGLDLGLERAGMTIAGQVEIDPWCRKVLAKHWPEVPRHDDVRTAVDWWGGRAAPDLVAGGFPCQPVSLAGKGLAQADSRWLWPAFAGIVRDLRPRYVLVENVPGLLGRGLGDVLGDLAAIGYDAEWDCVSAADVGAPHLRRRVWIVAYPDAESCRRGSAGRYDGLGPAGLDAHVADAERDRLQGAEHAVAWQGTPAIGRRPAHPDHARELADAQGVGLTAHDPGGSQWPAPHGTWSPEPGVGGRFDGLSAWVDRTGRLDESHKLLLAYGKTAHRDTAEVLRAVRDHLRAQGDERTPRGRGSLPPETVLLAYLRQLEVLCRQAGPALAGAEVSQDGLRGMRADDGTACPPLRREPCEQRAGEPPDAMHALSQLLARHAGEAWQAHSGQDAVPVLNAWAPGWDDGIPRVAHGVPRRVDRLRGLGNAVVPQVAEHVGRLIMAAAS